MVVTTSGTKAVHIPQPLLSYARSMVEPTGDWKFIGDYAIWTGNRLHAAEPYLLLEQKGRNVLPVPASSARAIVHPITRQTWFHVSRLFGFWIKADVDTVWIDAPGPGGHYYTLIVGGSENRPGGISTGWLCPNCGIIFGDREHDVSHRRFQEFLNETKTLVAQFNADESKRVCPGCGAAHPVSYDFV